MAQLICQNLSAGYDGKTVLKNLSFEVSAGDYLCIVGENGSVNSRLMKTIIGINTPNEVKEILASALGKIEIGYLPQQTQVQKDFPASVREIVLSGCQGRCGRHPFYNKEEKQLAAVTMQKLQIDNLSRCSYRELSGGQQQRVLLARALCATQKMIFLDEPISGLDPQAAAEMYALVEKLNREEGITVVMISHDIGASLKYAKHILHIGKSTFFNTKEEYFCRLQRRLHEKRKGGAM